MPAALTPTVYDERRTDADRIVDLFGFRGLVNLHVPLTTARAARKPAGRRSNYPAICLLATAASARITGSTKSALRLLHDDPSLWERCRHAFHAVHDVWLPGTPPTRDHVRHFRANVCDADRPQVLTDLLEAFTAGAVGQARALGNLAPGEVPDWATPDPRHAIFGDGTIVKPYSDVVEIMHPTTGEPVYLGSRAKVGPPKVQRATRAAGVDEKAQSGINFVAMHTRTRSGLVVLAVDSTLGAEAWTAIDLVDRVSAAAGDGVHSVVYDRALTGWHTDYLMAQHRIQLFGKAVARAADNDAKEARAVLNARVALTAASAGAELTGITEALVRRDQIQDAYRGDRLLPVGTSIYPTTDGYDLVYGAFFHAPAQHVTATGETCTHDLVVDDGALYTVTFDPLTETLLKESHLPCASSRPVSRRAGAWGRVSSYDVPCGDRAFRFEMTWEPDRARGARSRTAATPSHDRICARLHPVTRADVDRFEFVTRGRNDCESYNSWFKRSLPGKDRDRGSALTGERQLLDFLLCAVVKNSDTWAARPRT